MMLALSVRQPFAELILSGIKTIEYRSRPTRIIGQRFYLYASKGRGAKMRLNAKPWSADLAVPGREGSPVTPPWILELANALKLFPMDLPTGVIVGSAVIDKVTPGDASLGSAGMWCWHLGDVRRETVLRKPTGRPQPVWFREE